MLGVYSLRAEGYTESDILNLTNEERNKIFVR